MRQLAHLFLIGWIFAAATVAVADVKLAAMLQDHMVLQRDMPLPIWGTADPGEPVTVSIAGQTHKTTTLIDGNWQVKLQPLQVGDPLTLVVEGNNRIEVKDILVGEVWLCSGQSNMEWSVQNSWNADLEIPKANHPAIRLLTVTTPGSQEPIEGFEDQWQVCSPDSVRHFSAVGYFFGKELHQHLGVPIGLIDNAWGGSSCEAWVRRDHLQADPLYAKHLAEWCKREEEFDLSKLQAKHEEQLAEWNKKAELAKAAGKPQPGGRPWLNNEMVRQHRPANLYNGRLMPVLPFGIRGTIWYQGETNAGRAYQYRELFPLMIRTWRDVWQQGDFPFYWVQLADFQAENQTPGDDAWAELREAQTMTLDREPNTGQAVIIDIGEAADIHPRNKIEVARRLARIALAKDYGIEIAYLSPRLESLSVDGKTATLTLKDCKNGLRTIDSGEVQGFVIAGEDKKWHHAKAKIVGDRQVEVTCDAVEKPVAVRYAWATNPVCNLHTHAGLPVSPFRSDDWPGVTGVKE